MKVYKEEEEEERGAEIKRVWKRCKYKNIYACIQYAETINGESLFSTSFKLFYLLLYDRQWDFIFNESVENLCVYITVGVFPSVTPAVTSTVQYITVINK